jgi:hypothetical protein
MTRPTKLGLPFTHRSIRKLAACLSGRYGHHDPTLVPARMVRIGRERVRTILNATDAGAADPKPKRLAGPVLLQGHTSCGLGVSTLDPCR